MYHLTYRTALRMEWSLPSGTNTPLWDKLLSWCMRNFVPRLPSAALISSRHVLGDLTLPQPIMGAEPITISVNLWHGSHYSNHGGK
jgi:hypothetical protein